MEINKSEIGACVFAVIFVGSIFLPLATIPTQEEISYFDIAKIESIVIICLSTISIIFILIDSYFFSVVSITGVWIALLSTSIRDLLNREELSLAVLERPVSLPKQYFGWQFPRSLSEYNGSELGGDNFCNQWSHFNYASNHNKPN